MEWTAAPPEAGKHGQRRTSTQPPPEAGRRGRGLLFKDRCGMLIMYCEA